MDCLIRWLDCKAAGFELFRRDEGDYAYFVIHPTHDLSATLSCLLNADAGFVAEISGCLVAPITADRFNLLSSMSSINMVTVLASSVNEPYRRAGEKGESVSSNPTQDLPPSVSEVKCADSRIAVGMATEHIYPNPVSIEKDIASYLRTNHFDYGQACPASRQIPGNGAGKGYSSFSKAAGIRLLKQIALLLGLSFVAASHAFTGNSQNLLKSIPTTPNFSDRIITG